ncbi:MAG: DUF3096 domain-containing protein [Rhodocyclaceae bacterium]|jgi:hypothetical protein
MQLHLNVAPVLALAAGILIFVLPKRFPQIVALYLIAIGVLGLLGMGNMRLF